MFDRRTPAATHPQRPKPDAGPAPRAAAPVHDSPAPRALARVEEPVRKIEERPLTEDEIATKAALDSLFEREPALAKARELPDPALAREAVRRHNEREAQLAAQKLKEEARRHELEDKAKAREAPEPAAVQVRQGVTPKPAARPMPMRRVQKPAPATRTTQNRPAALPPNYVRKPPYTGPLANFFKPH